MTVDVRASTVVVLGSGGTTSDLVGRVLHQAGFRLRRLAPDERRGPGDAPVVVLVDPSTDDWEVARSAGRVVALVEAPLDPPAIATLVLNGADAVLHRECAAEEVWHAINTVAEAGAFLTPQEMRAVIDVARSLQARHHGDGVALTAREREILAAIGDGLSVKQTARKLGVAEKTIENLQSRLYRKLAVRNRVQALTQAHALGLID